MRNVPLAVLLMALFILGSVVSIPTAHAATITWNGAAGDGKWETAGNWVGGVLPGPGITVVIPSGAFAVTISTTQSILTLVLFTGDTAICESTCTLALTTLANAGTFTNFGTITIDEEFDNEATFTNRCHGTVNIDPTSGQGTFTTDPTCPAGAVEVPYSICVIQLGVQEQTGTIGWLPGYAYPGTPISECQNKTEVLGQDALDRTIVSHQFILNGTSPEIVPIPTPI